MKLQRKMKSNKIIKLCILIFLVITLFPLIQAKAILNKPSDWYAGDQHVHSKHSCLGGHCDTPIEDNADAAKDSRFNWLIITDHSWMFPSCPLIGDGWTMIASECDDELINVKGGKKR